MILNILNELSANSSRNFKTALLNKHEANVTLRNVMHLALDPFVTFYIKNIPDFTRPTVGQQGGFKSLDWGLDQLSFLSQRKITGNAALAFLTDVLCSVSEDNSEVIKRVVGKDLRCGVAESTVNSVWPGSVSTFDVCLAHKDVSHITYPAFAQVKIDGARCHLSFDGESVTAYSRNGKIFNVLGAFDKYAKALMQPGQVWDGEILFYNRSEDNDFGLAMDRKTSNGLANKALKNTLSIAESKKAVFVVWDIVDFTSTIPYFKRWEKLEQRMKSFGFSGIGPITLVESKIVNNALEGEQFYQQCVNNGEEGAILKNYNFKWEPKRVKGVGKIKACEEADLIVVGWEEGTGKNANKLGALICETSDGLLKVNVGTGFSDDFRNQNLDKLVGRIITVAYNQLITDNKKLTKSLFLPRFVCVRNEKDDANSLEELK